MNTNAERFDLYDAATDVGASLMVKATNGMGKLMTTRYGKYALGAGAALAMAGARVFAEGEGSGDAQAIIEKITGILPGAVTAMGSLVAVVGGIQLGVSFQNENPDGKTRGFQTLIGGAIIAAVGAAIGTIDFSF